MGRTKQIVSNPATRTYKWKNEKTETTGKGKDKEVKIVQETGFYAWDKVTETNIMAPFPFNFLWLESAISFTGFNKARREGIYSNEVLDIKTQPLTVKIGNDIVAEGLYNDIKEEVKGLGGKFCSAVYALADLGEGYEVIRILMAGSAAGTWITHSKNNDKLRTMFTSYYDTNAAQNGSVNYEEPVFKFLKATEEDLAKADEVAKTQIDPFFEQSLARNKKAAKLVAAGGDEDNDNPLPFKDDDEEDDDYDENA